MTTTKNATDIAIEFVCLDGPLTSVHTHDFTSAGEQIRRRVPAYWTVRWIGRVMQESKFDSQEKAEAFAERVKAGRIVQRSCRVRGFHLVDLDA